VLVINDLYFYKEEVIFSILHRAKIKLADILPLGFLRFFPYFLSVRKLLLATPKALNMDNVGETYGKGKNFGNSNGVEY
jgi:hypothetical protein